MGRIRSLVARLLGAYRRKTGKVLYIGGSDTLPPPLSPEEEHRAIAGFMAGSKADRDLLIEHNLRLVVYIARKFENAGIDVEDLISIGTIGLIKAVNTFKTEKKIKLATYASRCIENEILMYLRRARAGQREKSHSTSLSTWTGTGTNCCFRTYWGHETDEVYGHLEEEVNRKLLGHAMGKLTVREKEIVEMRFGLSGRKELTQKEVADRMGISQSYISRLEKKILAPPAEGNKKAGMMQVYASLM